MRFSVFWVSRVPDADMLSVHFARNAHMCVAACKQAWSDAFVDYDRQGRISAMHFHDVSRTLVNGGDTVALDVMLPENEVIVSFVPPIALFPTTNADDNNDDDSGSRPSLAWIPASREPRVWMQLVGQSGANNGGNDGGGERVRAICIPRASEYIISNEAAESDATS